MSAERDGDPIAHPPSWGHVELSTSTAAMAEHVEDLVALWRLDADEGLHLLLLVRGGLDASLERALLARAARLLDDEAVPMLGRWFVIRDDIDEEILDGLEERLSSADLLWGDPEGHR